MPASAFLIRVPEAEPGMGPLRQRYDISARPGLPPHITVLSPFMEVEDLDEAVFQRIAAALQRVPRFTFELSRVEFFPISAYLAPMPAEPFLALTRTLVQAFPDYPPYGGEHAAIVPNLTIAHGDVGLAAMAAGEADEWLIEHGAIHCACHEVVLVEGLYGRWRPLRTFVLPPRPREIATAWMEALNRGDADALAALYAPDAVLHGTGEASAQGRAAIRARFAAQLAAGPRICEADHLFEDGEWATLAWSEAPGGRGCALFRVLAGQIAFQRSFRG